MFQHGIKPLTSSLFARTSLKRLECSLKDFPGDSGRFLDPKIPLDEVKRRIEADEFTCFDLKQLNGFSANQMGVNRPVEDRWSAFRLGSASSVFSNLLADMGYSIDSPHGHLYTVIDGHGGHTCAHAVNLLHADYLDVALSSAHALEAKLRFLRDRIDQQTSRRPCELSEQCWVRPQAHVPIPKFGYFGPWGALDSAVLYQHSQHLIKFIEESLSASLELDDIYLLENDQGDLCDSHGYVIMSQNDCKDRSLKQHVAEVARGLVNGCVRLDQDIASAALPRHGAALDKSLLRIVMSGCVSSSLYTPVGSDLVYGVQVGDCGIVFGSYIGDAPLSELQPGPIDCDHWASDLLVQSHGAQNANEIRRLRAAHPLHEADFLIRDDRLLGELMPLRAFGDIRYKWPVETHKRIAQLLDLPPNYPVSPRYYRSPPYLTAEPQVACRRWREGCDQFVILATDGLWDVVTPEEAVRVVAQHLVDHACEPWHAPSGDSAASRLISTALGGLEMDLRRMSVLLSVPANIARYYRDDISVLVVYPQLHRPQFHVA